MPEGDRHTGKRKHGAEFADSLDSSDARRVCASVQQECEQARSRRQSFLGRHLVSAVLPFMMTADTHTVWLFSMTLIMLHKQRDALFTSSTYDHVSYRRPTSAWLSPQS